MIGALTRHSPCFAGKKKKMTIADYVAEYLIAYGVRDVFGIPGGVILPLLYAFANREPDITPHLNYHEQIAGFAACGNAQAGGHLGVAYATRGPGITNMITCIAEAWQESLPVLFITAHGDRGNKYSMRYEFDQEMNLMSCVGSFTKYAANIDRAEDVPKQLQAACQNAMHGRKGPVFLDFSSKVLKEEITFRNEKDFPVALSEEYSETLMVFQTIKYEISQCRRPIILIGDGIRQAGCIEETVHWLSRLGIPILSSRAAQDIACGLEHYYGYIGSHGLRYANFILSKTDLIIAMGNRLSFPTVSKSFSAIIENARIIRLEIDPAEFQRELPGAVNLTVNIRNLTEGMRQWNYIFEDRDNWLDTCHRLREALNMSDLSEPVLRIVEYMKLQPPAITYVCDVGNNEFWFSRAFEYLRPTAQVLYSKSFGTLGSALGRAIGAYHATLRKVVCVMGDQGFQYNIQELQYIAHWKLPITILLLNNMSSGMIYDQENRIYKKQFHVTSKTGYTTPNFQAICEAYGIRYVNALTWDELENISLVKEGGPLVYEISFETIQLEPNLPKGNPCQQMTPLLEEELYRKLNEL